MGKEMRWKTNDTGSIQFVTLKAKAVKTSSSSMDRLCKDQLYKNDGRKKNVNFKRIFPPFVSIVLFDIQENFFLLFWILNTHWFYCLSCSHIQSDLLPA